MIFIIKKNDSKLTYAVVKDLKTIKGMINRLYNYPKIKGIQTTYHVYKTTYGNIYKDKDIYITSVTI